MWTGVGTAPAASPRGPQGTDARTAAEVACAVVTAFLSSADSRVADNEKAVHAKVAATSEMVGNELYTCHLCEPPSLPEKEGHF